MAQSIHVEQALEDSKGPDLAQQPVNARREYLQDAQDATNDEHNLTLFKAIRLYPKAIGWSMLLSTAIIMLVQPSRLHPISV